MSKEPVLNECCIKEVVNVLKKLASRSLHMEILSNYREGEHCTAVTISDIDECIAKFTPPPKPEYCNTLKAILTHDFWGRKMMREQRGKLYLIVKCDSYDTTIEYELNHCPVCPPGKNCLEIKHD